MSRIITIDPSIAVILDIGPIGVKEVVPIYFTSSVNWTGNYVFRLWNSVAKNTEIEIEGSPITIENNLMTLTINSDNQGIVPGCYYYEIMDTTIERIIFKRALIIVK